MGLFIDEQEFYFDGVKTNVVGYRFSGHATGKWKVKLKLTTSGGYPQGAYTQLVVVDTEVIDKPWDRNYPNFHWTWTGGSSSVYSDLVEEIGDRTKFKVGRLISDYRDTQTGDIHTVTWSFDMTPGLNHSLVVLGGKFAGTVINGVVRVIGTTKASEEDAVLEKTS